MNSNLRREFRTFAQKLELFDAAIAVYITAAVREYFWFLHNNFVAWCLTAVVSVLLTSLYLSWKETPEKKPRQFWIVVALPLAFFYLMRVAYVDFSFDVLNYHIFHSERALRGLLHIPGDFAPAYFPFFNNPLPDMITGIYRHVLGHRLGTVVNFLALLWTGAILDKILKAEIRDVTMRSFAVLLVLLSEQLLIEINNYKVDLLGVPLLLWVTYLCLLKEDHLKSPRQFLFISLLLGASVALKLTNIVYVLPIGLIVLRRLIAVAWNSAAKFLVTLGGMAVAFAGPDLPYALYLYRATRNPVFPLYNKVFKSPYWPDENMVDGRWGPKGALQTLLWPLELLFKQERLGELSIYSGRITLGFCAALAVFFFVKDSRAKTIAFLTVCGALLWSAGTGYTRYALYLEVVSGIALVMLASHVVRSTTRLTLRRGLVGLVVALFLAQVFLALRYTFATEWGGRPTAFEHPQSYRKELPELLRDHSLTKYMNQSEIRIFDGVGAWVESSYKTSAITGVLKPDIPYLNAFADAFIATPAASREFKSAMNTVAGSRMMSVVFEDELTAALEKLAGRGFIVLNTTHIQFPYYSHQRRLPLVVMEVASDPSGRTRGIFNAQLSVVQAPTTLKTGESTTVRVRVRNLGSEVWPANNRPDGKHRVTLGNKWLDDDSRVAVTDDGRSALPGDLAGGEEVELELHARAPGTPGRYQLLIDLVQEQVSWFYERGSTPVTIWITVKD